MAERLRSRPCLVHRAHSRRVVRLAQRLLLVIVSSLRQRHPVLAGRWSALGGGVDLAGDVDETVTHGPCVVHEASHSHGLEMALGTHRSSTPAARTKVAVGAFSSGPLPRIIRGVRLLLRRIQGPPAPPMAPKLPNVYHTSAGEEREGILWSFRWSVNPVKHILKIYINLFFN